MDANPTARVRHSLLRRLLAQHELRSQAEILQHLRAAGVRATQATISRDLATLGAHKARTPDGRSIYVVPADGPAGVGLPAATQDAQQRLRQLARDLVVEVRRGESLLVLHSPAGAAPYLASQIDRLRVADILGTIAGDDTVLVIAQSYAAAARLEVAFTA